MKDWKTLAVEEGRICPDCKQPVSRATWADMVRNNTHCWNCRYAHWEVPLRHAGGSARYDNQDREAWNRIRSKGQGAFILYSLYT